MINRLLSQQLYKLSALFAPDCIHQRPALGNVRTLIVNGSELLNEFITAATWTGPGPGSAEWQSELCRFVQDTLVPLSLVKESKLTLLVLCFDAAIPHPARVTHPLQRQEHCEPFISSAHEHKHLMRQIMCDPERCAALYRQLVDAIALHAPLSTNGSFGIVLDGLLHDGTPPLMLRVVNGVRLLCSVADQGCMELCFPPLQTTACASSTLSACADVPQTSVARWIERSSAWSTADASDRIAAWTALHTAWAEAQSECLVQCANVYTLLKLLTWADVDTLLSDDGEERHPRVWFVHKIWTGNVEYSCGDSCTTRYHATEAYEYLDVLGVYRALAAAHSASALDRVAPTSVTGSSASTVNGYAPRRLITPLLAMLVLLSYDSNSYVVDTNIGEFIAEILRMPSYPGGMLRTIVHRERALYAIGADVSVCIEHAGFLQAMTVVMGRTVSSLTATVGARCALRLHRLYNAHLPWYEEVSGEVAGAFGFGVDASGFPRDMNSVALVDEYSVTSVSSSGKTTC